MEQQNKFFSFLPKNHTFHNYCNIFTQKKRVFTIKENFKDWWNKFIEIYSKLSIKDVIFFNIERMLKYKTQNIKYAIYICPNCNNIML